VRKIYLLLAVAFVVFFVVKNTQHLLGQIFTGIARFINSFRS
jgi:hypothetical protein